MDDEEFTAEMAATRAALDPGRYVVLVIDPERQMHERYHAYGPYPDLEALAIWEAMRADPDLVHLGVLLVPCEPP